jgi:hypothetical protein
MAIFNSYVSHYQAGYITTMKKKRACHGSVSPRHWGATLPQRLKRAAEPEWEKKGVQRNLEMIYK